MQFDLARRLKAWTASDEEGVTAIEYGLLAALIAVVIIASVSAVGTEVEDTFDTWTSAVRNAIQSSQSS
ncbi:MAG: Flp family type IVb pilin [Alphaproteobacteria bacterium]|nr:Flp family type IVb pilin [Alphaproteobacteria bacterium]